MSLDVCRLVYQKSLDCDFYFLSLYSQIGFSSIFKSWDTFKMCRFLAYPGNLHFNQQPGPFFYASFAVILSLSLPYNLMAPKELNFRVALARLHLVLTNSPLKEQRSQLFTYFFDISKTLILLFLWQ